MPAFDPDINAQLQAIESKETRTAACYEPWQSGYQDSCYPPGYQIRVDGYTNGNSNHWGPNPYDGSGLRDVYVIDELGPGRNRDWLQWTINRLNFEQAIINGVRYGNRPVFHYYTVEYMNSIGQYQWANCEANQAQYLEVCRINQAYSDAGWNETPDGHNTDADNRIHYQGVNDNYNQYVIVHEFGHTLGFAHDQDCQSVMTYCGTVGNQYLYYSNFDGGNGNGDQVTVYNGLYDTHQY